MGTGYAIPLQKTHSIVFETRRLCYPWHPWHDRSVLTRRAAGAHADVAYFCKLPEVPLHAMLVEIPKWMFDAVSCATMRLAELPQVDCAALRALKHTMAEQSVSVDAVVIQPQLPGQAGHGGSDGTNFKKTSEDTAGAVQRASRGTALERSGRANASGCGETSGSTASQRSLRQSKPRFSKTRAAR